MPSWCNGVSSEQSYEGIPHIVTYLCLVYDIGSKETKSKLRAWLRYCRTISISRCHRRHNPFEVRGGRCIQITPTQPFKLVVNFVNSLSERNNHMTRDPLN